MPTARFLIAALTLTALVCPNLFAQEKPKPEPKPSTLLKLQVVISETEGEKKVGSLPYTLFLTADFSGPGSPYSQIRIGSRIPAYTGKENGMQYLDVGTKIDARAQSQENGLFDVVLNVDRSWVDGEVLIPMDKLEGHSSEQSTIQFKQPILHEFRTGLTFKMRDGQTVQSTQAADPVSGRVLTLSVTMNVVK
ncbi:MAG TPA: hypothetical protein VEJ47_04120 [Candidatus Eremiobacteraceae bacterium]|nr:hypothetical protein [Candidatus Eremiobacteraceae bacterium]